MKRVLILLFALRICTSDFSQVVNQTFSPEISSLAKYFEIPVSKYTGVPEINIPLYEIKIRDMNIPISISYHASGIKVEEEATWVGLGWSLNAEGSISRQIIGSDDFYGNYGWNSMGYTMMDVQLNPSYYWYYYKHIYAPPCLYPCGCTTNDYTFPYGSGNQDYCVQMYTNVWDPQPDMYYYNFGGKQGKFFYDKYGTVQFFEKQKLKITSISPASFAPDLWQITSDDGIVYTFGSSQFVNSIKTSWYLTKIETPKGEVATFTYEEPERITGILTSKDSESKEFESSYSCPSCAENKFFSHYLKRITFSTGCVQFFSSKGRRDLEGARKLDSIVLWLKTSEYDSIVSKTYKFKYDYFKKNLAATGNPYSDTFDIRNNYRLKFLSLKEYGGRESVNPYTFEYDTRQLPPKNSFSRDHWGYYNGAGNSTLLPRITTQVYSCVEREIVVKNYPNYVAGADREADDSENNNLAATSILKTIFYPTGGTTSFEYQPNHFTNWIRYNNPSGNGFGGGVRVSKISDYDPVSGSTITRNFKYGRGLLMSEPTYLYTGCKVRYIDCIRKDIDYYVLFSQSNLPLSNSAQGGYVGYDTVKVIYNGASETNGYTTYVYYNIPDIQQNRVLNLPSFPNSLNGNLREQIDYNNNGSIVKKITNDYINFVENGQTGLLMKKIFMAEGYDCPFSPEIQSYAYDLYFYINSSSFNRLHKQVVTDYSNGGPIVSSAKYYYYDNPNHYQLTRTKTFTSDGRTLVERIKYPNDYSVSSGYIKDLQDKWLHNIPLEIVTFEYKASDSLVLSAQKFTYKTGGKGLIDTTYLFCPPNGQPIDYNNYSNYYEPELIVDKYKDNNPIQYHKTYDINTSYIWGYKKTYPIAKVLNAKSTDVFYTSFEETGGVINTASKTGRRSCQATFIKNLTGLTSGVYTLTWWKKVGTKWVMQIANNINVTSSGTYQINIPASISNPIDEVRFYPTTAMMTTYTYDPLIGLTSSSDENGKTTYYVYDRFERLNFIKDQDFRIIQEYNYHYKQ